MGVEAQANARAGGVGLMGRLSAQYGDILRSGGEEARTYAERVCARLDDIRHILREIRGEEDERTARSKAVAANTTEQIDAGRPGYIGCIQRIAVTADAATTVDIFVGSASDVGFRHRINFAAAGRDSAAVSIDVPEGAQIFAVAGAGAARVNLQVKRQKATG